MREDGCIAQRYFGTLLGGVDLGRAGPFWVLYKRQLLRAQ